MTEPSGLLLKQLDQAFRFFTCSLIWITLVIKSQMSNPDADTDGPFLLLLSNNSLAKELMLKKNFFFLLSTFFLTIAALASPIFWITVRMSGIRGRKSECPAPRTLMTDLLLWRIEATIVLSDWGKLWTI